jgi:hypothetical protein
MPPHDDTQAPFPAVYFEVRFRATGPGAWPARFVIVTAWATTGERWSDAENQAADQRLFARLRLAGHAPIRVTGYSPATGHAEAGWAVELGLEEALGIGRDLRQHAIYAVDGDALRVLRCADGLAAPVGSFRDRLDAR